ncbi:hypothetical protein TSUD_373590 [Trifolium subterraneum]|uniref:Uncharacterized protein n=1 Tax=Trifolium subterraneum TaxID=3900 RepID=A0A2Z6M490_TRISU|nr:hypothetical protein TSUD_373590 [Trifolium subterraneum]
MGWDVGEWTEVKQRLRKERRQAERFFDDERQRRRNRSRSTYIQRRQFFNERQHRYQSRAFDHAHTGRFVSDRYRTRSHTGWDRGHRWTEEHRLGESRAVFDNTRFQSFSPTRNHGHHSLSRFTGNSKLNFDTRSARVGQDYGNRQHNYHNRSIRVGKDTDFDSKGFEVYGEPYGFVKFANVCDVNKLSKALNAVYFGHFRVHARVARFDRNDVKERRSEGMVKEVSKKGHKSSETVVVKHTESGKAGNVVVKGNSSSPEEVRVGDIVVRIGTRQEPTAQKNAQEQAEGLISRKPTNVTDVAKENEVLISLRKFRTMPDDVEWVQNGLVATIINGEAVPVVQNRITDAGFNDLFLVPMGADKVFVRSSAGVDAREIVNGAKDFFSLLFSNWERWGNVGLPYQRGAWVRLYGIPIHAWNVNFFKMCVFDCGRFLRADSCSVDRDRLDFARVLIATPDLEIIKRVETVLVEGTLTKIKIVEEWGYALGEDTCLFEDESGTEVSQNDNEVEHDDPEGKRDVDMLVKKLVDGMEKEDDLLLREKPVEHLKDKHVASPTKKDGIVDEEVQITHMTDFSNVSPRVSGIPRKMGGVVIPQFLT